MGKRRTDLGRAALAAVIIAISFTGTPLGAEEVYSGKPIKLELSGADLEQVLGSFSEMTGFVFAVEPEAAANGGLEHDVSVLYESTPWDQVLDEILTDAGLSWTLEGRVVWIHRPGFVPEGDRTFTGEPINLRLDDADIRDVLETFSSLTGHSIEPDSEIEATVTVRLKKVPWDQVLDLILQINGLGSVWENDSLRVYRKSPITGKQIL
jgi:type II secretory pathway component HofQ